MIATSMRASLAGSLRPRDLGDGVIELLVGAACIAIALPCWRQGSTVFRVIGVVLASPAITAVVNAVVTLVR